MKIRDWIEIIVIGIIFLIGSILIGWALAQFVNFVL